MAQKSWTQLVPVSPESSRTCRTSGPGLAHTAALKLGRAVSDLARAQAGLGAAEWAAEHSRRWRDRRAATKESATLSAQVADAEQRWRAHVLPEVARLETVIYEARQDVELLVTGQDRQVARWFLLAKRGNAAGRAAEQFAAGLGRLPGRADGE